MRTRIRQALDQIRHRLYFVPLAFVAVSVALAQLMLWIDRRIADEDVPRALETTVDSGRAILSTIAGGLIASITLLLSLMLVAIQLGNSQFSPRTLRDWVGDRTQQVTIGVVLGTTVYCLLALRRTRSLAEGDALTPHLTVLVAVALGVLSLIAVVRSVDHLAHSLRVGAVAGRIAADTIAVARAPERVASFSDPGTVVSARVPDVDEWRDSGEPVRAVATQSSGWVQQIDEDALLDAMEPGQHCHVVAPLGGFVMEGVPLVWLGPDSGAKDDAIRRAFAIGDTRTLQQDISFGIMQLVDVALRALSPGVNDPNTARDIIVQLGGVLLALWELPAGSRIITRDQRTLVRPDLSHEDYLHAAFDQVRRYGSGDVEVTVTMLETLQTLKSEVLRRSLPGPVAPLDDAMAAVRDAAELAGFAAIDRERISQAGA